MSYAADPRWHGPPTCPRAPKGCDACSGEHHWLEHGVPEEEDFGSREDYLANTDGADREVVAFDALHGTEHRHAHYQCKHCPAWCEAELFWEMEDDADNQADEEADEWAEDLDLGCGGTGVVECECGGDQCVCGLGEYPCPGCEDCACDGGEGR